MQDKQTIIALAVVLKAIQFESEDAAIAAACSNVLGRCGITDLPAHGIKRIRCILKDVREVGKQWEVFDTLVERWSIEPDK